MPHRRQHKTNISVRNVISQCSFNSYYSHKFMGFQIIPDLLNLVRCHYLFQLYFIFTEIMFQMSSNRSCHQITSFGYLFYRHPLAKHFITHQL